MADEPEKATLLVFSGEMDKAMAAFVIATGAASMGMEVTMFFTFWGMNCLRTGKGAPGKSPIGKMLGVMNPGSVDKMALTHLDMMGLGRKLMKDVMTKKGIASLRELMDMAREMDVRMVACQMSMEALEISKEELIYPEIEIGGVAVFLAEASASKLSLFV
jgi:peroxiredoxin family protein